MKLKVLLLVLFVGVLSVNAQKNYFPADSESGIYHSLKEIKHSAKGVPSANKKYKIQFKTYAESGNKLCAVEIIKGSMPLMLSYAEDMSEAAGKTVLMYGPSMFIRYDKDSFVFMFEDNRTKKSEVHFFSKTKATVDAMTEQKAKDYAMKALQ